jgi:hypothetical protein
MQYTGVPAVTTAGSTICITVTGASGTPIVVAEGSVSPTSVVITQSASRPTSWTICFKLGQGRGKLTLSDAAGYKTVGLCGL